jgi:Core-2/I-Branching enzyme
MKIAYLIIAHDQPKQFERMIKALDSEYVSFFVHIDSKRNISEFSCPNFQDNVTFIKDRVSVERGGFSLTQAMINLMKKTSILNEFDYFIFLSGRDYPIKDNNYIYNFLKYNYPMNFINFYPLVGNADSINNIKKYYFIDLIHRSPRILQKTLKAAQLILHKLLSDRYFINNMIPYRGSQWFCLNRQTVDYIVKFIDSQNANRYIGFFKYVWGSDEIFFQTLVLNSTYARQCRYYDQDIKNTKKFMRNENKAYLHYIDWHSDRENPAIFDIGDFQTLKAGDELFARKFCENKSKQLLDDIDHYLLKIKTNN